MNLLFERRLAAENSCLKCILTRSADIVHPKVRIRENTCIAAVFAVTLANTETFSPVHLLIVLHCIALHCTS